MIKLMPRIRLFLDFIKFYFSARTIYEIDSPLIFSFCESVLDSSSPIKTPITDVYRQKCSRLDQRVSRNWTNQQNSQTLSTDTPRIKDLVRSASSSRQKYQLIVQLALWNDSTEILELGTNLGFTSLALAENDMRVTSIEGNPYLYEFLDKELSHENLVIENDTFLSYLSRNQKKYDLIYIDGNHQYDATLELINQCHNLLNQNGIILIDDIRWSAGMKKAWSDIQTDERFNVFLDLFMIGLISQNDKVHSRLHFKLMPRKFKPWPYYFFRK